MGERVSRTKTVEFQRQRWSLIVTFDSLESQAKSDWDEYRGVDEAFRFVRYAAETSGALWEELREMIQWPKGSRTIEVSADIVDYLATLQQWVTFHTIPLRVELVRNDKERGL